MRHLRRAVLPVVIFAATILPAAAQMPPAVPVIYGTDLLHPHDDPDDHFDLATVFAMPGLELKAILLDLGERQKERSGRTPVEQMLALTGRRVPYAAGLSHALQSPDDTAARQPGSDQGAVELLIRTLRESPRSVIVITTGSSRDVCAAFNREPALLREKIARLYINSGHIDGGEEWNVKLDPHAYVGLMRSGLPIYWCPCMPVGQSRSTFWKFRQQEVLETAPPPLLNFFIYGLQQVDPKEIDPIAALRQDLRPFRRLVFAMDRNMWSTSSILDAAGLRVWKRGDRYVTASAAPEGAGKTPVFDFIAADVTITDAAVTSWKPATGNMRLHRVVDAAGYEPGMKSALRDILAKFPVAQ